MQIEKFVVEREVSSEEMSFRLSLTQAKKHNSHLSGIVSVLIFGKNQAGEDELFDFNPKGWKFRFKYLQKISGRFTLPAGFKPSHVQVTAKTKGKKPVEVTEEFVWQLTEKKNANAE